MSNARIVLMALHGEQLTVPQLMEATRLDQRRVRGCLTELDNRVLVTSVGPRPKSYMLTTLGNLEARRLTETNEQRVRTPEPEPRKPAPVDRHHLANIWRMA